MVETKHPILVNAELGKPTRHTYDRSVVIREGDEPPGYATAEHIFRCDETGVPRVWGRDQVYAPSVQ